MSVFLMWLISLYLFKKNSHQFFYVIWVFLIVFYKINSFLHKCSLSKVLNCKTKIFFQCPFWLVWLWLQFKRIWCNCHIFQLPHNLVIHKFNHYPTNYVWPMVLSHQWHSQKLKQFFSICDLCIVEGNG
jgi:hypothetical protein